MKLRIITHISEQSPGGQIAYQGRISDVVAHDPGMFTNGVQENPRQDSREMFKQLDMVN